MQRTAKRAAAEVPVLEGNHAVGKVTEFELAAQAFLVALKQGRKNLFDLFLRLG